MQKKSSLFSPFFVYILGFLTLFLVYNLRWSDLYPEMSMGLLFFILVTCFIMTFIGILFHNKHFFEFKPSTTPVAKLKKWCVWYLVANLIEIAYSRRIPFFTGLVSDGSSDNIDSFGIPIFHVFVLGFGAFLSLMLFYKMRSDKSTIRTLIFFFLLSFAAPIIIYGRGIMFMTLTGCLFIYLFSLTHIKKKVLPVILIVLLGVFLFGVLGDIRIGASDSRFGNQKKGLSIMKIGQATKDFEDSCIPHEFMWIYIYMISPIGNLQYNIDEHKNIEYNTQAIWELFSNEMLSETIGKRVSGIEKREEFLVIPVLNVSTVYARPYVILGWWGVILIYFYTLIYILMTLIIVSRNSEYFIVTVAILNIIIVFNLFDNMFTYGGYANVIFIPLLMSLKTFLKRLKRITINEKN